MSGFVATSYYQQHHLQYEASLNDICSCAQWHYILVDLFWDYYTWEFDHFWSGVQFTKFLHYFETFYLQFGHLCVLKRSKIFTINIFKIKLKIKASLKIFHLYLCINAYQYVAPGYILNLAHRMNSIFLNAYNIQ